MTRGLAAVMAVLPPRGVRLAAQPPLRHCERERSEREAIQKRQGHAVRLPPITCGAAGPDCFGGYPASQ